MWSDLYWTVSDGRPEAFAALDRMGVLQFYHLLAAARRAIAKIPKT